MNSISSILKKCLKQDRISQQWLYQNYYAYSLKVAFRYCIVYDDAVNIVNDSFVNIFKSLHQFNLNDTEHAIEKRFTGWLRKTLINKALDRYRSNINNLDFQDIDDDVYEISGDNTQADTLLLYNEMIVFLKRLPALYQLVFNMHVIDGYTHPEIATMLHISEGTSKSYLHRAKQILQVQLTTFFEINR